MKLFNFYKRKHRPQNYTRRKSSLGHVRGYNDQMSRRQNDTIDFLTSSYNIEEIDTTISTVTNPESIIWIGSHGVLVDFDGNVDTDGTGFVPIEWATVPKEADRII